jgi:hypothetical protein
MVKKLDGKERKVLECVAVVPTKRYLKYKLPESLFEDEEPEVLFSTRHVYVLKAEAGDKVREIVLVLPGENGGSV